MKDPIGRETEAAAGTGAPAFFEAKLRALGALVAVLVMAGGGCGGVSPEDIERWKATADGAERLVAVIKQGRVAPGVRAQAAAALVESGHTDRMEAAISGLPIEQRADVIPPMVPLLAKLVDSPDTERAGEARDALYCLREQSTTDHAKNSVDMVLLPALEKDLRADRARAGRRGTKDILIALRTASLSTLLAVLDGPKAPFQMASEVLDKVGDGEARARGGAALVRQARAQSPVPAPLWTAIATLGGEQAVDYLMETVDRGLADEAELAAQAMVHLRRDARALAFAIEVAGRRSTSASVRQRMFEVAENMGGEEARKGLIGLITGDRDPAVRFRAFAGALKVGRGEAVLPGLEAMPLDTPYTEADVHERLVKPISDMPGFDSREGVFKALESRSPLARLVAILVLEKMGFSDDSEHVGRLSKDKGTIRGLAGRTVGKEAARVSLVLKKGTT
jgi:hypothetical protein